MVQKKVSVSKDRSTKKEEKKKGVVKISVKKSPKAEEKIIPRSLRGMRDILPEDQPYWERVRRVLAHSSQEYGFQRIDTPLVEYENLFTRLIGTSTDIVDKEMYTFTTRGGDKVALRPEFTAGIARAYIEHGMGILPKPVKLFSLGPVYRYDRPQEGRYREFWQGNFELYGEDDAILDAQTIQLAYRVVQQLGLKNIEFQINSIGVPESRKEYSKALVRYLEAQRSKLCQNCRERLSTNPMRILDCKEDKCIQLTAQAPQSIDYLDEESRSHFKHLLEYLDELELPYVINTRLVRGLDYYTKTVFEIWSGDKDGKKYSLGGGGRYDRLVQMMGGEATPAIGFALGIDRVILEMKRTQVKPYQEPRARVFLAQLGEMAKKKSLKLFSELEKNGILIAESFGRGSLKSQMRVSNRMGAEVTIIIGQKEALDDTAIVKDMVSGTQETVIHSRLVEAVKKILHTNQELKIKEVNIARTSENEDEKKD
ncbi:MAG: histidine--tRNA ligase [Candidatus Moranbacteria bacterium]|nr:histidine--tRNA ligase [Candidatus Moranbacteria bacterium]OIQ02722.1 MAG: histidine--tRNA ligase [Candidatus Moranbacteria bacterium CG2_30_41_165]PIP26054.1 MAG: histidine--tRNA ligase [Candidatus Moranbacteria bacterium CG23_combo_of_CG06-09_8_20_14_all_41_28]PIV86417.1 MAG: histidine--tRNA ligase [Candidatus Moranbacteria bacterium CG17_big_fil_post_rev_8_21_14_2_50_41_107]PIW94393.1 MAG: histidine--tRNA ligase [Candidatus Moranbacteria bacterium CG_4_8_14_3_um_filter_41_13]PIX91459.1 M